MNGMKKDPFGRSWPAHSMGQGYRGEEVPASGTEYFSLEQREAHRLTLGGGYIKDAQTNQVGPLAIFATKPVKFIYAMSLDEMLYGMQVDKLANGRKTIHHSSFLAGGDVLCAGTMLLMEGKLYRVSNDSGHYTPGKDQLIRMIYLLRRAGFPIMVDTSHAQGSILELNKANEQMPGSPVNSHPKGSNSVRGAGLPCFEVEYVLPTNERKIYKTGEDFLVGVPWSE